MLEFTLEGKDDRRVDFADTADFCRSLVDCLRRMHRVDHPGTSKLPRYRIQKLEIGSAVVGLSSDQGNEHAVVLLTQTLSSIRNRRQYDAPLNAEDIRAFRSLSDSLESQTSTIVVADIPIDAVFRESCDWMLAQLPSLTSLFGLFENAPINRQKISEGWE